MLPNICGLLNGTAETHLFEWKWQQIDSFAALLSNQRRDVLFHPIISSGTAVLRADTPLRRNVHHYWEIEVLSKLYGTDVMIGLATGNFNTQRCTLEYCSILGSDGDSWGYSYLARVHHLNMAKKYGTVYSQGSIVGVHVDMFKGTVEFYLDGKPLGVAFTGIKTYRLYPMLSSTSAKSKMRLRCSVSREATLQFECLKVISQHGQLIRILTSNMGNLAHILRKKYFWLIPPSTTITHVPSRSNESNFIKEDNVYLNLLEEWNDQDERHRKQEMAGSYGTHPCSPHFTKNESSSYQEEAPLLAYDNESLDVYDNLNPADFDN